MTIIIGFALVWAGAFKLLSRRAPIAAAQSGLSRLVGTTHVVKAFRALGAVELVVAASLLVTPIPAIALCVAFLAYLAYTRVLSPESSCGCTSARKTPIGWRSFTYTGGLLLIGVGALAGLSAPWWGIVALAVALAAVNPDLDRFWLTPFRHLKVRLTHPLQEATSDEVPLLATIQQLQRSDAYRRVGALLRSDVVESWDEGEWRLVRYSVTHDGRPANAIFAVPRLTNHPERVRLAIVE
ncbi:hypothetical protein Rhe02_38670 [Rhizocola hellebori]|uniref:Methylamine utilisation protein MauE domain-containing protein n=1 Tax=Rhizocola hellebori TaxID=1392758 RepID=A0A8J3VGT6_9ACTN|nr:MauE/DoxX family redox-associated membrane protein [Rhizocola hellebori]GIH05800.1 hypothetical protein Rhe02_38670 [Rhizocola hellebori]